MKLLTFTAVAALSIWTEPSWGTVREQNAVANTMLAAGTQPSPDTTIEPAVRTETERNEAIIRQAFEKWAAGRGPIFEELLADDVIWTIHGSGPVADTYRGREDFTVRASAPLLSRLSTPLVPSVDSILADGDMVVVRFSGSATTTSGAEYRNEFVWLFRMRGGRVVEAEAFLDLVAYQEVVDNNEPRAQ